MEKMDEQMQANQEIIMKMSPKCSTHQKPLDYICDECFNQKLACGDCLLDFHGEHMKKVKKIQNLLKNFQKNSSAYRQKWKEQNIEVDQLEQLENVLYKQHEVTKAAFVQEVMQMVDKTFINLSVEKQKYINSMKDPQQQYIDSKHYFEQQQCEDNQQYYQQVKIVEELNIFYEKAIEKHKPIQLDQINVDTIKAQMDKHIEVFTSDILPSMIKLEQKMCQILASHFDQTPLKVFTYSWSNDKQNSIKEVDGARVICGDGCEQQRFILSNETINKNNISYFEVQKNHVSGCYDSFGVCSKREVGQRNGSNANGWAVRLYGSHGDKSFTGKIHNGVNGDFFDKWEANCRVGILYNPFKKTLSYFHNGKFIGTPFDNVVCDKELYVCLECCHHGSFEYLDEIKFPEEDQYENLI